MPAQTSSISNPDPTFSATDGKDRSADSAAIRISVCADAETPRGRGAQFVASQRISRLRSFIGVTFGQIQTALSLRADSTIETRDKSCLCWCSGCSRSISQHMQRRSCGVAIQIVEAVIPSRSRRHHSNCTSSHDVRTRETRVRVDLDSFFACGARQPMQIGPPSRTSTMVIPREF